MRGIRSILLVPVLIGLGALLFTATADEQALITLGVTPMPPDCVQNPGGTATITWLIEHQTVPDHVVFTLYDPTHTIVYDSETYPGDTGLDVERTWTVPSPLPDGMYWVRIEYFAQGIGLEAWAETGFMVCLPIGVCCVGHDCYLVLEEECTTMGGAWHPEWSTCDDLPCEMYTPAEPSNWGAVKELYR